jgi:oxaloacetate decarboxylase beta subunit
MTDFGPLLENPRILLLGAAGQFGIFLVLLLALAIGFPPLQAVSIGIIGAMDGPDRDLCDEQVRAGAARGGLGRGVLLHVTRAGRAAADHARTHHRGREAHCDAGCTLDGLQANQDPVSDRRHDLLARSLLRMAPLLLATIMLGNLMRECGVVERLASASANEITNVVTLLLGISIGATMEGARFLNVQTLIVFALGFAAICLDTVSGVMFGKLMCAVTRGRINPLIGAAGISAFPMAARVVQTVGQSYNRRNYLLMHAMGAITGGQIGSVMAAGIMLSVLAGLGLA